MRNKRIWEIVFVGLCISILSFLLLGSTRAESPTYDEVTYVEAGYQFLLNRDFRFDPFNPPLAKEILAIPTLINKNVIYDPVIFWPRVVVILFTLTLAVLVYIFSKRLFGDMSAKLSLILFIFEPNILANGHYATADLIFTFFLLLSLYCYWIYRKKFTLRRVAIFSVIIGLFLSAKLTSIPFLIIPLLGLYVLDYKNKKDLIKWPFWKKRIRPILLFIFIVLITLWGTYFFKMEPPLGYRFDTHRQAIALAKNNQVIRLLLTVPVPLGSYISTIKQFIMFNSKLYIKRSYFLGMISLYGISGYYFPVLFLLKTPLAELLFFFLSLYFFYKNIKRDKYILFPLFFIFFIVLFSDISLVNRYILPVYPLVIIYAGQIINLKIINKKLRYVLIAFILIWFIGGTVSSYPYFISYANEIAGGSKTGYEYFVDSNYDWGQGLIALKKYQDKNNIKNLQLAYFGSIDPVRYGIEYEKIKNLSINDYKKDQALKYDKNHTIAISATCWYFCGYYKNLNFKNSKPVDIVGGSILIFKINE